jgi:hypothetical protein
VRIVAKHALWQIDIFEIWKDGYGLCKLDLRRFAQHVGELQELYELSNSCRVIANGASEETETSLGGILGDAIAIEAGGLFTSFGKPFLEATVVDWIDTNAVISGRQGLAIVCHRATMTRLTRL